MQYGFRPGRSCEHAFLNSQNKILGPLNKKEVALLLLIDFWKAFDMVDREIFPKSCIIMEYEVLVINGLNHI